VTGGVDFFAKQPKEPSALRIFVSPLLNLKIDFLGLEL